jgi:hypothetical protein
MASRDIQGSLPRYYPKQKEYKIEDLILESNMEDREGTNTTGHVMTHIVTITIIIGYITIIIGYRIITMIMIIVITIIIER